MFNKILILSVLFIIFAFNISCGKCETPTESEPSDTVKEDPSFSQDIQPIFTNSCAVSSCHDATAQSGLILLQNQSYANMVNVDSIQDPSKKRVEPGNADNSYLVIKIEGTQTFGGRMPLGGGPLSSTQIQNIKNWINREAKDN